MPPSVGDRLVNFSIGADGALEALWCAGDDWDALFQSGPHQPQEIGHGRALRPVALRLSIHRAGKTVVRTIESVALAFPLVRRLPGDRTLVVGNKCVWHRSGPERNAVVYDQNGRVLAQETWGDDITHLAVAADGTVWVGYGAIAIWGTSNGWGDPGPPPPGWRGVIRYEPDTLQPIWHYPQENSWGHLDHCSALNLAGDSAWICYYADFPIVRITGHGLVGWHNGQVNGANALAVDGSRVALYGGYDADADLLRVATLNDGRLEITHQYRLVLPDGAPVKQLAIVGSGATLHTVAEHDWLELSLPDMTT